MGKDWGGIERYVAHLAHEFRRRGIDSRVAAPRGSPLAAHSPSPVVPLRLIHKYDPLTLALAIRQFRRIRPAFVVAHYSPDYLMPALAARIARVRCSLMTRHVAVNFKPKRVESYRKLFDGFIAISQTVREQLIEDGLPESLVRVALSGCVSPQPSGSEFPVPRDRANIGVFGRLHWVKGQDVAIKAMRDIPSAVLHIFGEGPYERELRRLAQPLGGRVQFHGYLSNVADALAAMDLVVVPSIWKEAFGLTVAEAMALGKPIVANATGGIPELIDDGRTGILIHSPDPEKPDPADFALAISALMADRERARRIAVAAQESYRSTFTIEAMADRTIEAYRSLIDKSPKT